ncbi:ATP-binding protein [Streptomyces sp. NPDC001795]|uniref:ATP-binding protein n=1 Tax=Streptomyces sp. NPDC001795 TaxID=3154525 RepID=UPI00332E1FF8
MPTHQRTFPGDPEELRTARSWTRAALHGHPHSDDAALIVTELGTNALMHTASGETAGTFRVTLTITELITVIAVTDSGSAKTAPEIQRPSGNATHGRGLGIVASLADNVMIRGDDSGRTITAELRVPTSPMNPSPCYTRPGGQRC